MSQPQRANLILEIRCPKCDEVVKTASLEPGRREEETVECDFGCVPILVPLMNVKA